METLLRGENHVDDVDNGAVVVVVMLGVVVEAGEGGCGCGGDEGQHRNT